MMRIATVRFTLLAVAMVLLAGCSGERSGGPVEVVYWTGWSHDEFDLQQKLVDEFNGTHPNIHVRLLGQFTGSGTYQKVRIAFAGGATPELMSTIWAQELTGYAMRDVLEPLDDYLKQSGRDVDREYAPGVAKMLKVNGHVYGLAVTTNTNLFLYNKGIFRQVGLDPDRPPQTIEELDKAAKACTLTRPNGSFVRYGFRPTGLEMWAYVFGGQWYDEKTGRVTANDPHNLAALQWMCSYAKNYDIQRMQAFESAFGQEQSANASFFVGKQAMWPTGEWAESFIKRYADKDLDWGFFALPAPPGGRRNVTMSGGSVFVIPKACKHKKETWEFLNWLTQPHQVARFCLGIHNVPPTIEAAKDPGFQDSPLFRFAIKIAQGRNAFPAPPIPIWTTFSNEIGRTEEKATLGGEDPKALLDDLQDRMSKELEKAWEDLKR
jgi:multiple sugar transport system substrate-binding protein